MTVDGTHGWHGIAGILFRRKDVGSLHTRDPMIQNGGFKRPSPRNSQQQQPTATIYSTSRVIAVHGLQAMHRQVLLPYLLNTWLLYLGGALLLLFLVPELLGGLFTTLLVGSKRFQYSLVVPTSRIAT